MKKYWQSLEEYKQEPQQAPEFSVEGLTEEDYGLLKDILCGISSNKERINYFFIFALSALALIIAVYIDFIK